jgi:hypothetical protein
MIFVVYRYKFNYFDELGQVETNTYFSQNSLEVGLLDETGIASIV